jgi:hypothetical protein
MWGFRDPGNADLYNLGTPGRTPRRCRKHPNGLQQIAFAAAVRTNEDIHNAKINLDLLQ